MKDVKYFAAFIAILPEYFPERKSNFYPIHTKEKKIYGAILVTLSTSIFDFIMFFFCN